MATLAILSLILGVLGAAGSMTAAFLPTNKKFQEQQAANQAAAQATYTNNFLPSVAPTQAAYNNQMANAERDNLVEWSKKNGVNPLTMLMGGSNLNYSAATPSPLGTQPAYESADITTMLAPLSKVLSDIPTEEEQEFKKLQMDDLRARINERLQNTRHRDELFKYDIASAEYKADLLKDQVDEHRQTFAARVDYLQQRTTNAHIKNRLDSIQVEMNDLLLQKEQEYAKYYENKAFLDNLQSSLNTSKTSAETSKIYQDIEKIKSDMQVNQAKIGELNSKMRLNEKKVEQIGSDLESDWHNHATSLVDSIIDPDKNPKLNQAVKAGTLLLGEKGVPSPMGFAKGFFKK